MNASSPSVHGVQQSVAVRREANDYVRGWQEESEKIWFYSPSGRLLGFCRSACRGSHGYAPRLFYLTAHRVHFCFAFLPPRFPCLAPVPNTFLHHAPTQRFCARRSSWIGWRLRPTDSNRGLDAASMVPVVCLAQSWNGSKTSLWVPSAAAGPCPWGKLNVHRSPGPPWIQWAWWTHDLSNAVPGAGSDNKKASPNPLIPPHESGYKDKHIKHI